MALPEVPKTEVSIPIHEYENVVVGQQSRCLLLDPDVPEPTGMGATVLAGLLPTQGICLQLGIQRCNETGDMPPLRVLPSSRVVEVKAHGTGPGVLPDRVKHGLVDAQEILVN